MISFIFKANALGSALTLLLQLLVNTLTLPYASIFPLSARGGSYLTISNLNYISIPATVALVTAAMVTSQSVQVEWPECGPWLPDGKRGENRTNPSLWAAHTRWLPTAVVTVSYESVPFSVREAISEWQRRTRWITRLLSVCDSDIQGWPLSIK